MCGRFTQTFSWATLVELYQLMDAVAPSVQHSWNVAPSQIAGTILQDETGLRFQPMQWGLVPSWAKDRSIGSKLINARAETLAEKPAFKKALTSRRCVVPVSGFYEWRKIFKGKQPYFITGNDGAPLSLAGLWEDWKGVLTFTIITVPASKTVSAIHDRMPAILTPLDALQWLKTGDVSLLKPFASEALTIWAVSSRINSPANNDAKLIENVSQDGRSAVPETVAVATSQLSLI